MYKLNQHPALSTAALPPLNEQIFQRGKEAAAATFLTEKLLMINYLSLYPSICHYSSNYDNN